MAWWMAIPAVLTAASSVSGYVSGGKQNSNQRAWNQYNAGMQYRTDLNNIAASQSIAGVNAAATMAAGSINAQMARASAALQNRINKHAVEYNAGLVKTTAMYNDDLLEEELSQMWESMELDLTLLENQRAVERGAIEGQQAASGVVMGQDSNADVIVDQKTQEALDAFVVRHNADIQAASISNARSKGLWEANSQIQKLLWEGQLGQVANAANAELQAGAAMAQAGAQAGATLAGAAIQGSADRQSAGYRYQSGMAGSTMQYNQNRQTLSNNLVTGMFSAASMGVGAYFKAKPITPPTKSIGTVLSTATRSAGGMARTSNPAWERVLRGQLSQPGTSLL